MTAKEQRKKQIEENEAATIETLKKFKEENEIPDEEFDKFISIYTPEEDVNIRALQYFFKAYIVDQDIRKIIETKITSQISGDEGAIAAALMVGTQSLISKNAMNEILLVWGHVEGV
mgnify:CR=1 FL=1